MDSKALPCCFYPTEVVFVDDNKLFLDTLDLFFQSLGGAVIFKTFLDPQEALNYINQKEKIEGKKALLNRVLKHVDTFQPNCYSLALNVSDLHCECYHAERFEQISVLIADYELKSKLNGLDVCKRILDTSIQKILFTGQNDMRLVIDAFNDGIIQRYVHKHEVQSFEKVARMVFDAQNRYFEEISRPIIKAIDSRIHYPLALYSSAFQKYWRELLARLDVVEYYLIEAVGSYLLITRSGQVKILFVQNVDQFRANLMDVQDEFGLSISEELGKKLEKGESIVCNPCFIDGVARQNVDLLQYILPAELIRDEDNGTQFYCALTDDSWLTDREALKCFKR